MTTNLNTADEEAMVIADGLEALGHALTEDGMAYTISRCTEQYTRALDAARRVADAAGLKGADRRAYLAHVDALTRAQVLADAVRRRDQEMHFASQQLAAWRRATGARIRSLPQSLHEFEDR